MVNPKALEKYRLKKGYSVSGLAKEMGKTPGWYSRIRNGKVALAPRCVQPLAELFGVRPEKLAKEYFSDPELEVTSSSTSCHLNSPLTFVVFTYNQNSDLIWLPDTETPS